MSRKRPAPEFTTDAGKAFAAETVSVARGLAARKSAETRALKRAGERFHLYQTSWSVFARGYGLPPFPCAEKSLAEVIDLFTGAHAKLKEKNGEGFIPEDMVVYRGHQVAAVIRYSAGPPVVTLFDID